MPPPPSGPAEPVQIAWIEAQLRAIVERGLNHNKAAGDAIALRALALLGRSLGMFSRHVALPRRIDELSVENLHALLDRLDGEPDQVAPARIEWHGER